MTKLATFKVNETLWENFKQWANEKDSNASNELVRYIQSCVGSDLEADKTVDIDNRIDKIIDDKLKSVKERLKEIEKYIDKDIDTPKKLLQQEGVNSTHKDRLTMEDTERDLIDIKLAIQSGVKRTHKDIAARLNLKGLPSPIEGKNGRLAWFLVG